MVPRRKCIISSNAVRSLFGFVLKGKQCAF